MAKKVFGNEEEVDRILAMPVTGLRIELKNAFRSKNFTEEQYKDFVERLSRLKGEDLEEQIKLVEGAIQNRKVESSLDIDLSTPAKQLLWAAGLTRMMQLGEEPIVHSEIWSQLKETRNARNEMIATGHVVYSSLQNDDTSVSWGQPGSWFYFNPLENHINLDLYFSLLTGFEHIRSVNLHEIGHSELSNKYSPRMQELYEKLKDFIDPSMRDTPEKMDKFIEKMEKMTEAEQKELALIAREWELRFMLWHMVEDNCVNQFSTNMSESYPQDFGYSLNHISTVLQGFGELARGDRDKIEISSDMPKSLTPEQQKAIDAQKDKIRKEIEHASKPLDAAEIQKINKGDISPELAMRMFTQIKTTVLLAFYENNGMFKGRDETWKRFRIFPEDIRRTVDVSKVPGSGGDAFSYLVDLSAGKQGINTLQPQPQDRYFGKEHYQEKVAKTTDARIQVMDHIWDLYLDKFAQVLLKQFEKEVEQQMKQQQNGQGQPEEGQPGEGQPGEGEPGEGGQPGSGKGQPRAGSGKGGGQPKPLSEALKEKLKNMKGKPEDKRASERDPSKEAGEGADKAGEKKDKEAPGGKGWEQDPQADQGKPEQKVGDLRQQEPVEDLTPEQKEAMKEAMKSMDKPGQGALSMQGGHGRGLDLAALAKGDWKDFNRRVVELSPIINSVADALRQIREAQKKQVMKMSKDLDYMAEDGDFIGRLDKDKVLETKYRQAARMPMKSDDFKKFQEDKVHVDESTIEFFQMIDGSGSMPNLRLTNTTTAMEAALQSAVIMYMACRKAGIDAYIMMWGAADPLMLATPNSELKKVGELLETLRNGTSSGTDLAPGLKKSIGAMAEHVNRNGTISGSSHIQVYSDGDIFDPADATKDLEMIARNGKNLTVDVAVLRPQGGGNSETSMEEVVNAVIKSTNTKMIGLLRGHDANEIPKDLSRGLLRRVRGMEIKSEPDSSKRRRLKNLHQKMKK